MGSQKPPPFKTLRLTLAMRGGVSLAVWIGGVVAELDLFRRACTLAAGKAWTFNEDGEISNGNDDFLATNATDPPDRVARAGVYRSLLLGANYRGVEIDILAGASAGGLNAVLYGVSQVSRSVLDETVRRTWINEGGIWELLHPSAVTRPDTEASPRWWEHVFHRRLSSILQGDTRLYEVAHDALNELTFEDADNQPERYGVAADRPYNIAIELAATLLDDVYSPGRGNRAGFAFRRTTGDLTSGYSTVPLSEADIESATEIGTEEKQREKAAAKVALTRMALAARSTSSFPGAFEPARLRSDVAEGSDTGVDTNMARVFPHARTASAEVDPKATDRRFNVVDGGIFDNIPIDRAIRAIRRAPSALPTERRLVYIDPEPPSAPVPVGVNSADAEARVAWLPVILASKALQQRNETAADELAQLRAHNDSVWRTQGRLEALASRLGTPGAAEPVTPSAYIQHRIGLDATRIGDLLTDPWSYVCQTPRSSADYHALAAEQAVDVGSEVREAYNHLPRDWPLSHDVYAVLDQIRLLVAWVRELERLVPPYKHNVPDPIDVSGIEAHLTVWKRTLYRYLLVATEAKQQTVDLVLTERLKGPVPASDSLPYADKERLGAPTCRDTLAGAIWVSQVNQHALRIPDAVCVELRRRTPPETDRALYAALAAWVADHSREELQSCPDPFSAPGLVALCGPDHALRDERFCTAMVADLDRLRVEIRDESRRLAGAMQAMTSQVDWVRRWRESVFAHFNATLANLDIVSLTTIFAETGTPDTAALVHYEEITSDLQPAELDDARCDLEPIRRAARAKHLRRWLRREPNQEQVDAVIGDPRAVMNADAKLAGNELSRFGGFFLAKWRENDWQWGRLDAAAGIVKMLPPPTDSAAKSNLKSLQGEILKGANTTTKHDDDDYLPLRVGTETLDSIGPHYRFALASRAVPLLFRALLPTVYVSPVAVVQRIGILLLRLTIGVIAPLIADPLRLAIAATVIISAAGLLGGGETSRWWLIAPTGLAIAIGVRTYRADKRWGLLLDRIEGFERGNASDVRRQWRDVYDRSLIGRSGSRWCRRYSWALGGLAALLTVISWWRMPSLATLLLLVAAVTGLHLSCMRRTYRIRDTLAAPDGRGANSVQHSRALRGVVSWVLLGVALCCAYLAYLIATVEEDTVFGFEPSTLTRGGPAVGVVAVSAALLVLNSLWGWASDCVAIGVTVLATGVGAGLQWVLELCGEANDSAAYDLLPVAVWLVVIGLSAQYVPCRQLDRTKRNTLYGEKDRPLIVPAPTPQASHPTPTP